MATTAPATEEPPLEIDLRDPYLAALLAWLWPGAGHLYQRRYLKAALFMSCILTTYFFGLALGEGKVVYASWNTVERRWQFVATAAIGLPAAPAIIQSMVVRRGNPPLWNGFMAPPRSVQELSDWQRDLNVRFELGTLYAMIAGLLNILAIWDAYGGPVIGQPGKERGPPDDDGKSKDKTKPKA